MFLMMRESFGVAVRSFALDLSFLVEMALADRAYLSRYGEWMLGRHALR